MKKLILVSLILMLFIAANAQVNYIEIEYRFNVSPPTEGTLTFFKILKDDGKASIFINKDTPTLGSGLVLPFDKNKNFGVYINKVANKLYEYAPIYNKDFYILDDSITDKFQWTLYDTVQKIILGYNCKLATCEFRGRQYKAYYSELLPFGTGPWKLNGLPGTILEAFTKDGRYEFLAYRIITNAMPETISNPYNIDKIKFLSFIEHKKLLRKKLFDGQQKLQSEVKGDDDITYSIQDNSIELLIEQ